MSDPEIHLEEMVPSRYARLVAAEPCADGTTVLYRRTPAGTVTAETVPFQPWLLVAGEELGRSVPGACELRTLTGAGVFNIRLAFPDAAAWDAAVEFLKQRTGRTPSASDAPYRLWTDHAQQFLAAAPARLFRDLTFQELRRLQLDIETRTTPGFDFPNAARAEDAVLIIALRDSTGWEQCLAGPELDEKAMLQELVRLIRERDPDVIEGHNLFNFDLPYLAARAKRHKVKLLLGRDGSAMSARASRFSAGERTNSFTRFDIHGRHVIDTYQLVQLHDVAHRDLESYGLKAVARHFGVAAANRTYLDASQLAAELAADPERVRRYAMDDVRETDAISRLLSPSHFYQAQLLPLSYQNCVLRGNGMRIDALLCAEYLRCGAAWPRPQAPRPFQGALSAAVRAGLFHNVWHVDVASLYPSLMVAGDLAPASDTLRLFPRMLTELRRFRLAAKSRARTAAAPAERDHSQALQGAFKILINSFYGYAGFAQGTFNDFDLAETVTARGRAVLEQMLAFLNQAGATVIELDTDGIYFVPPAAAVAAGPEPFLAQLQATLPPGIDVELDAVYPAMFSYKSKNYALLDAAGRVALTGAALKSRGLEPFQRRYIKELLTLLLTGRGGEAAALLARTRAAIQTRQLPLADFAQREVLSSSPQAYADKLAKGDTRRSAAYELALKSPQPYSQGDQVAFYLTGDRKNVAVTDAAKRLQDATPGVRDENVPYYLDKLEKLHAKFAEWLPAPDFFQLQE